MVLYLFTFIVLAQGNSNASCQTLYCDEQKFMRNLKIIPKGPGQHCNAQAICWNYFGGLYDGESNFIDDGRVYFLMCLEMQQSLGDKWHLSLVTSFTLSTSSSNMKLYISQKHGVKLGTRTTT